MNQSTIQRLYQVFSKYGKPNDFPACKCCLSDEEKALMLSRRLSDLSADDLGNYAADVFLTVGSSSDFKYFLPRILELSVREEFLWPDPEVALRKLNLANWVNWPQDERTAVLEVLQKKFNALVDNPDANGQDIDQWICALGQCVEDITPYLEQIFRAGGDKLQGFVEWNLSAFTKGKLGSAFWEANSGNEQKVLAWLNQPRVKAIVVDRYGCDSRDPSGYGCDSLLFPSIASRYAPPFTSPILIAASNSFIAASF